MNEAGLRKKIVREAKKLGADLIGFAPISRWREHSELKPEYWPDTIWRKAETVIVMGIPMLLPIVESTPSINHTVLYDTTNVLLTRWHTGSLFISTVLVTPLSSCRAMDMAVWRSCLKRCRPVSAKSMRESMLAWEQSVIATI